LSPIEPIWYLEKGAGPLVATAIHDGHDVRDDVSRFMSISASDRRREEDPFTGLLTTVVPTRVVGIRSRFEVDLNRPRESAVYRTPEDAWGLQVWSGDLPDDVFEHSLLEYDAFYETLFELYSDLARTYGRFVVLDLHTYNHLRDGPDGPPASPDANPQVNVGTGTMLDRDRWAPLIDRFISDLSSYALPGGRLDVRENVKFFGGNCARWAHSSFPESACVLSIELKKIFMNEWTGIADPAQLNAIRCALESTVPGLLEEISK